MDLQVSTLWIEKLLHKPFHKHSLLGDKKFFDPHSVPVGKDLEDNFNDIQAEIKEILKRYDGFAPFQSISTNQTYISNDDKFNLYYDTQTL